jgi:hypothetical protein
MSDRKYRQRGYQDDNRERQRPATGGGAPNSAPRTGEPRGRVREPRAPNMPGFREVVRCARCGHELTVAAASSPTGQCSRCGADLHACAQCIHFDPGSRFECMHPIPVRIAPKDARNTCDLFEPRTTLERETGSAGAAPTSAKKAFDDLFKF